MYTIKEVSEMLNLPTSTLRYYESEGLYPSLKRSSGNQRIFTEDDLLILKVVVCLKKTKMPIQDIKNFITLYKQGPTTIAKRKEIFSQHKEDILQQIKELEETLVVLDRKMKLLNGD